MKAVVMTFSLAALLSATGFQLMPRSASGGTAIGGACVPGPNPCRRSNAVACTGAGCAGQFWDECIIGNEGDPKTCHGPDTPQYCVGAGCELMCGEWCID